MKLTCHIIATTGRRLARLDVTTDSPGLDRPTIYAAEQAARAWARASGMRVISDIVSQGEYRAWVQTATGAPA